MNGSDNLIGELEDVLSRGTVERRIAALNHVTELFLASPDDVTRQWIDQVDEVFVSLVERIEEAARQQLSIKLSASSRAPAKVVRMLASDESIEVAGPVLSKSEVLDEQAIIEIVKSRSQQFLLAVSSRTSLGPAVTDVLISRGDREVVQKTARNQGAQFSEEGYRQLVDKATDDEELAHSLCVRSDLPRPLFLDVLQKASETVRRRLETVGPDLGREIQQAIVAVSSQIQSRAMPAAHDYATAGEAIKALEAAGRLNEEAVRKLAIAGNWAETTVALATLAKLPVDVVERAMEQERTELILIIARAIALSWATTKAILLLRGGANGVSPATMEECLRNFERLKQGTAQHAVRFYLLRALKRSGTSL